MQVACEADSTSKYSLARSCDDCKVAYKNWLCNVAIPRCEDYTSSNSFAYERNVGHKFPNGTALSAGEIESLVRTPGHNASRNKFIDEKIGPGPYKEILPCDDLCYEVVQSCPAVLGFQCPQPGMIAFNSSYGRRFAQAPVVTCNYPGQPRNKVSGAGALVPSTFAALGAISMSVALATL